MPEFVDVPPLAAQRLGILSANFARDGLSGPEWTVSTCLRLKGPIDDGALQRSLEDLAARHELLRARLAFEEGRPWVRIARAVPVDLTVRLLGEREGETGFEAAREEVRRHAALPIDPWVAPAWRVLLVGVDPATHLLSFVAHHLFVDGWSLELVAHDIASRYCPGPDPAPIGPATSYQAYAASEQRMVRRSIDEWLASEVVGLPPMLTGRVRMNGADRVLSAAIRHRIPLRWGVGLLRTRAMRSALRKALVEREPARPAADRSAARPPEDGTASSVTTLPVSVGAEATARLRSLTRSLRTTEAVVLGALVLQTIHETFGFEDVWAWSLSGGRTSAEEMGLVGNFPDIFPIRARVGEDVALDDVVADVRSAFTRFYRSGGFCAPWARPEEALTGLLTELPADDLAAMAGLLLDPGALRVFYDVHPRSTVAAVRDPGRGAPPSRGLSWTHEEISGGPDRDPAGCQLGIRFAERDGALGFEIRYDADRLAVDLVERFSDQLLGVMEVAVDAGHRPT